MERYEVRITASAAKDIRKLPADLQRCVFVALTGLVDSPRPHGVKKLEQNEELYRVRVGEYRIVYAVDDAIRVVAVRRVRHRSDVYRR